MLLPVSLISATLGVALACSAAKLPVRQAMLERAGGLFLVVGLALLGAGLPFGA